MKSRNQINIEFKEYVGSILSKYATSVYKVEYPGGETRGSIDFVVKTNNNQLLLVKVSVNIDDIGREEVEELKALARCLNASPIVIGLWDKHGDLEDDVVYDKQGVYAVTPAALAGLLRGESGMIIISKKGGYFASIDSKKLRMLREVRSMSLGEVADKVGVTRKTIYEYERGRLDVSIDAATKLVELFGEEILKPINPVSSVHMSEYKGLGSKPDDPAEVAIIHEVRNEGDIAHSKRTPLDLSIKLGSRRAGIVVRHKRDYKRLIQRARGLSAISRLANLNGFALIDDAPERGLRIDLEDLNIEIIEKKEYKSLLKSLKEES